MKNFVQLIGRCGADPIIRNLTADKQLAKVSLATSVYSKDAEGNFVETTTWHHIVAFNRTANVIGEKFKKGSKVLIEGHIKYGSYENKEGQTVNTAEVIAEKAMAL